MLELLSLEFLRLSGLTTWPTFRDSPRDQDLQISFSGSSLISVFSHLNSVASPTCSSLPPVPTLATLPDCFAALQVAIVTIQAAGAEVTSISVSLPLMLVLPLLLLLLSCCFHGSSVVVKATDYTLSQSLPCLRLPSIPLSALSPLLSSR